VGNEFHPVEDTMVGEFFVKRLYDLVSRSPAWERTLLVITFDENGGTYDHFPPPPTGDYKNAVHRPSVDPAVNGLPKLPEVVRVVLPGGKTLPLPDVGKADFLPGGWMLPEAVKELDKTTHTQFGFEFDMFGLRVPALLISPYIKPRTVFRSPTDVPFDHTSIIATILKWRGIDPATARLGERVTNAPTFEGVLEGIDAAGAARPRDDRTLGVSSYGRADKPQTALRYGDEIRLRYVGNPWPQNPSSAYQGKRYLGGPEWALNNYWYPYLVANAADPDAFKFKLVGGPRTTGRPVPNGASVEVVVARSSTAKAVGYKLAVPDKSPTSVADTVWLTKDTGNHTHWRIWLLDDRVDGTTLYPGDQVLLFSERYQPDKVSTGASGYDPYMRLAPEETSAPKYLKFRAGEWDVWKIEQ
jgi:phospholipase C